jgi:radical SAM protein with 4Fe4S-binding SPASM domain
MSNLNSSREENQISKLGGMARVFENNDFFGCPPWVNAEEWWKYRQRYYLASTGNPDLVQVDLELSDNCNYKCLECPISDEVSARTINRMSRKDIESIIKSSSEAGAQALKINYINEPLLDPDMLLEVAELAKDHGFIDVYFTTNGSLLTSRVSENIISSNLITRIQVSLDAYTNETYKKIRRGGNLDKVKSNIFQFLDIRSKSQLQHWPKIRVSFLSLPENLHELHSFERYWKEKVDAIALQSSVLKPKSTRTNRDKFSTPRDTFCPNPFRQLVVRADGTILPCCSFWGIHLAIGKLNHDSFKSLFSSDSLNELRNSFTSGKDRNLHEACVNCLNSCDPTD